MAIMCAWASMSEYGTVDGEPGDQTTTEVKRGDWYYFGQDAVFRFHDAAKARQAAALAGALAENDHVGYGQSDRLTLYNAWSAVNFNVAALTTDVNCDCSSFVAAIVNAVGISVSPATTTYSMQSELMATGQFDMYTDSSYLNGDYNLQAGDIVNASSHHVIMVTANVEPGDISGRIDLLLLGSMIRRKKSRVGRFRRHI